MELPACFKECGILTLIPVVALVAVVLMAIFGGKRCRCSDYLFGAWSLVAFAGHVLIDSYLIYTPKLVPMKPDEPLPKVDDFKSCYLAAVRKFWHEYAENDQRLYMDESVPMTLTVAYGLAIGGGILTFLTFLGHLSGAKFTHPMQIATAMWHLAMMYTILMPEYLVGFKHIKGTKFLMYTNLPLIIMPVLALLVSCCKLCGCCSSPCAPVCCAFPGTSAPDKKKKQ